MRQCNKHDGLYIDIADRVSKQSYDEKIQVGCVIVKDNNILAYGWNGTPSGMDNTTRDSNGITKKEVIHSEANAIAKLARTGGSSDNATLYCTHSCCWNCAKLILQAGVTRLVYIHEYDKESIKFLKENNVEVDQYGIN